jgi:hypothetical protein
MESAPSESFDDLPLSDLRRVVSVLVAQVERLQADVSAQAKVIEEQSHRIEDLELAVSVRDTKIVEQADEIARLKGLPPRPKFPGKPSGMEKATSKPLGSKGKGRKPGRGSKRDKLTVTKGVKLKASGVPAGSRFRGYEDVTVQDLHIETAVSLGVMQSLSWTAQGGTPHRNSNCLKTLAFCHCRLRPPNSIRSRMCGSL